MDEGVIAVAVGKAIREMAAMRENLGSVQARCTELLEENRLLRNQLKLIIVAMNDPTSSHTDVVNFLNEMEPSLRALANVSRVVEVGS